MITLGQTESDKINRIITMAGSFYFVPFSKWTLKADQIKRLITLTSDNIKRFSLYMVVVTKVKQI